MIEIKVQDLDLGQIADSGQVFRMNYVGKGTYSIVAYGKYVEVCQYQNTLIFSCTQEEFDSVWREYFDLDTDYSEIKNQAKKDDYLDEAIKFGSGIRILKQELWETLVTFIISQRKSIPSIKKCVETLAYRYGSEIKGKPMEGKLLVSEYAFPTPEQLSNVPVEELRECGLGYRDIYVSDASKWFLKNMIESNKYHQCLDTYTAAKNLFMQINGVGDKVANCICLFSLHHLEACPIDTHMQQIIDNVYQGIMPEWMVSDKAGLLQQFCFYYKKNNIPKLRRD